MSYTYEYPRPMVTVDAVLLHRDHAQCHVLLVQRKQDPFEGRWALPGGFIEMEETLLESVERELREETGLEGIALEQFGVFGDPGRDPRGRSITVAFVGRVEDMGVEVKAGDDAADARWFGCGELPEMAFDHAEIVAAGMRVGG